MLQKNLVLVWSIIHLLYTIIFCYSLQICFAAKDTLTVDRNLSADHGQTLVSTGERFELGFFSPSYEGIKTYVGIWYKSDPDIVVWVANRDQPLRSNGGILAIVDGNLQVLDGNKTLYWSSTSLDGSFITNPVARLMDSGNFVLSSNHSVKMWQSFDHATDTFLPGMKMDIDQKLTSWRSDDDPGTGNFTFDLAEDGLEQISECGKPRWKRVEPRNIMSFDEMPFPVTDLLSNLTQCDQGDNDVLDRYLFLLHDQYKNTRLVMNTSGSIQYWTKGKMTRWSLDWREPSNQCSKYNACGDFGVCSTSLGCKCLPGFESNKIEVGCIRKSGSPGASDTFVRFKTTKASMGEPNPANNESDCRRMCLEYNHCLAYSFIVIDSRKLRDSRNLTCLIWTEAPYNLQEEYTPRGHNIYIRVAPSDIESTSWNCETCGTNLIPYPLSTNQDCGDPMYYSFHCDNSTGRLTFNTGDQVYQVNSVNSSTQSFTIQVDNRSCGLRDYLQLNQKLPFKVNRRCYAKPEAEGISEIEISWTSPQEPICNSSENCNDWPSSSCNLTRKRCLCKKNFRWNSTLMNCTQEEVASLGKPEVPGLDRNKTGEKSLALIIVAAIATSIILSCLCVYLYKWLKSRYRQEGTNNIQGKAALQLYENERGIKDLIESGEFNEENKKDIDLPFYEFETILVATDNFSEANMLGKGGFGPVYKGTFSGGQEIAVKRLSSASGQGLEEFKNEVVLIAKLQHRNLVRLLGYCIRGEEKILLYEYMPNKSLDFFIFDSSRSMLLDWEMRFNIILGIARGLLYLHQDSRLRIIHRDLKTSNILLDLEMNPKISDFGLARMCEGKQTEGNTNRVVGTYGYMSPEYALDGFFSVKSDVFSFGVMLLEIICGVRNTGFYQSERGLSLLGYTWRLWKEDKTLDLMDQTLGASCNRNEFMKCVNIGLLCVQEDPGDRPIMSNVVVMLSSENASLAIPKQPAFVVRRESMSTGSSSYKVKTIGEITDTLDGR